MAPEAKLLEYSPVLAALRAKIFREGRSEAPEIGVRGFAARTTRGLVMTCHWFSLQQYVHQTLVYQIVPLPTAPRMLRYSGMTPLALRCRLLCHLINVQGCIQQCEALHLRPEPQAWKCEVPVKRRFHLKPGERFCKLQEVALRWNASRHCRSCSWAAGVCALPFLLLLL